MLPSSAQRVRNRKGVRRTLTLNRRLAQKVLRRSRRLPAVGMPSKKLVRLRYVEEIQLNASGVGLASHYFSANGMFDPNVSGTGHQPLYYDQWMTNYDHYQVIGSKIKVTALTSQSAGSTPGVFGIVLDDDPTLTYLSAEQAIESNQNGKHWRMYGNYPSGINTGGSKPSITRYFSAKKFLGDISDKHEGTVASNPTDQAYFGIWAGDVAGNDPGNCAFLVEIEYIALLKEPKFVAQS